LLFDNGLCFENPKYAHWFLWKSSFWGMTSYFLSDNKAAITSLTNKTFWVSFSYSVSSFILFFHIWKL
jgi:hypothetical protein